jgi:hypothetical protein
MIVMTMAEKNPLYALQVFIEQFQIGGKAVSGARIKEIPFVSGLDQGAESVLSDQAGSAYIIIT